MKITKDEIKKLNPCNNGWKWYLNNQEEDLLKLLLKTNGYKAKWSRWLFTSLMNKKQRVEIAIFSAKKVLYIFEDKYTDDLRPRKAIEAAEKWLKNPSKENAANAANAAYAAYATNATNAANAAANAAAYAAADAADAVADATNAAAADAAADAADAAAAERKKLQEEIIIEAVRILEREK